MQPYFLPYIGYFQLINSVDKFILLDDVNYIKKGYINRNQILINGRAQNITIPLSKASQNKYIKEIQLVEDLKILNKIKTTVSTAYAKAPFYHQILPLFISIIDYKSSNISDFNYNSLKIICDYLEITTEIIQSSSIYPKNELEKTDRIINIIDQNKGKTYINPIGGTGLYKKEYFKEKGITLNFIKSKPINYSQHGESFVPFLSILDILMFNNKETLKKHLNAFELI